MTKPTTTSPPKGTGPREATLSIPVSAETAERLRELAEENGEDPALYARRLLERHVNPPRAVQAPEEGPSRLDLAVARMTRRTPEEIAQAQARAMESSRPGRPLPEGKTWLDVIAGQWPGDETDEEIQAALDGLS